MIPNMSVDSPKRTVIINSITPKLVCPLPTQSYASFISYDNKIPITSTITSESTSSHKKGRKRSLDHLSYEEKLQRKKLKNREAAQTSRDRKKAKMEELEKVVKFLEKNNRQLVKEVNTLKSEKQEMHKENERLKEELRCARCALESTSGSAESSVHPLPQGHSSHQSARTPLLIHLLFLNSIWIGLSTMISMHCRLISLKTYFKISYHLYHLTKYVQRIAQLTPVKWWGRHQHCWNPVDRNLLLIAN